MHVIMIRWDAMYFILSSLVKVQTNATQLHAGQIATLRLEMRAPLRVRLKSF